MTTVQCYQNPQGAQVGGQENCPHRGRNQRGNCRALFPLWLNVGSLSEGVQLCSCCALGTQAAVETAAGPTGAAQDASPCPTGTQALRCRTQAQNPTPALQTALSLISMTSPRNLQPQRAFLAPSFVEFDMSVEGYGYGGLCI